MEAMVSPKGCTGWVLMVTSSDATEVQPSAFVTVKLYVPVASPEIVVSVVEPEMAPGLIVQLPEGNPLNSTVPVATAHVG